MYFVAPRREFSAGWRGGGNRARFEGIAQTADPPMGVIAYKDGRPVGWAALGPRTRYPNTISSRAIILKGRDSSEDEDVWLAPCFFVRVGYRGKGLTSRLLISVVELAREHGAKAVEGFPLTAEGTVDEYLGREHMFAACGFECVARPTPRRAVMRRNLRSV
jgi:GNAT superfamily N-acetyltransferase